MKKLFAMSAVAAVLASPVMAQEPGSTSITISATSDYVFRGITQTDESPALQASLDYSKGAFYAGAWVSNIDFAGGGDYELDIYGGYKTSFAGLDGDFGVVGYLYPSADGEDVDYLEAYGKVSKAFENGLTLGGAYYFSPDFSFGSGAGHYLEANVAYAVNDTLTLSGAYGRQEIEENAAFGTPDYNTWNLGATLALSGVGVDVRYHSGEDADVSPFSDERLVVSAKYSFGLGAK